jgi:hypothetical protein
MVEEGDAFEERRLNLTASAQVLEGAGWEVMVTL